MTNINDIPPTTGPEAPLPSLWKRFVAFSGTRKGITIHLLILIVAITLAIT